MSKKSKFHSIQRRINGVSMPIGRKRMRWMRNWNCLCGSGKKYKRCCMRDIEKLDVVDGNSNISGDTQELPLTRRIRDMIFGDNNDG